MNVIWLSANEFGYKLLQEALKIKNNNIKKIITLSGNSKTVMYDGLETKKWYKFGLEVFEIDDINKERKLFEKLSPDIVIVCGWRQKINKEILKTSKNGFIGFHPTLLPIGRGPAPIINSILKGFKKTGVTMFYLTEGLDDGDIIGQEKFTIQQDDHAEEVYKKTINSGKKLIKKYLPLLINNKAPRNPQDHTKATFFQKPILKDNQINIDKEPIEQIYNKIRALSKPYKGAYIEKNGKKIVLWRGELLEK